MAATNKQIYDAVLPLAQGVAQIQQSVTDIVSRLDRQNGSLSRHESAISTAQSDLAVLKSVLGDKVYKRKLLSSRLWGVAMLIAGVALAVLQALIITGITDLRNLHNEEEKEIAPCSVIPTEQLPTPSPSATPTRHAATSPSPTRQEFVHSATAQEVEYLAALCFVEVRGMNAQIASACASVVDTVYERMSLRMFSDGTVEGTLTYDCEPGDTECHFPAYVVNGCTHYSNCPYDNPQQLEFYKSLVTAYLSGELKPECAGYVYYGMKPFDVDECTIEDAQSGQYINFHN